MGIRQMRNEQMLHRIQTGSAHKVRAEVSKLACFILKDEAAKSDFWYQVRILPWLHVDAVLSIFTCNCQLRFETPPLILIFLISFSTFFVYMSLSVL